MVDDTARGVEGEDDTAKDGHGDGVEDECDGDEAEERALLLRLGVEAALFEDGGDDDPVDDVDDDLPYKEGGGGDTVSGAGMVVARVKAAPECWARSPSLSPRAP